MEFSVEAPSLISPDKSNEFPQEPISPRESLELRIEGMRGLIGRGDSEMLTSVVDSS